MSGALGDAAHVSGSCLSETYYVGVDGGGSTCRVRVVDASGRPVGAAEGGSANVYLDFPGALDSIRDTVARGLAVAGLEQGSSAQVFVGLGLAGVSSATIADRVAGALSQRFGRVDVRNDAVIACMGAHAGRDGGLVIAGTGSAAVLRLHGQDENIGGRGFLLGDDGSGAVMGRQAWRVALRAHDGLEPVTPLLQAMMAEFSCDPVAVIEWGRAASSGQFATHAPQVLAAADAGDAAALPIVADAARAIGDLVDMLDRRGAPRISLVGGLASRLDPWLPQGARSRLHPPLRDALDGALLLAGAPLRVTTTAGTAA